MRFFFDFWIYFQRSIYGTQGNLGVHKTYMKANFKILIVKVDNVD